jgi:hypothetical protein
VIVPCRKAPAGWNAPLVGAGYLGGIAHFVDRAWGSGGRARSAGLVPTGRIPQSNLDVKLSALFLAALVENLGEVLPDWLTRFRRELLGKRPQFLVLVGGGIERLARLRRRQAIDIGR